MPLGQSLLRRPCLTNSTTRALTELAGCPANPGWLAPRARLQVLGARGARHHHEDGSVATAARRRCPPGMDARRNRPQGRREAALNADSTPSETPLNTGLTGVGSQFDSRSNPLLGSLTGPRTGKPGPPREEQSFWQGTCGAKLIRDRQGRRRSSGGDCRRGGRGHPALGRIVLHGPGGLPERQPDRQRRPGGGRRHTGRHRLQHRADARRAGPAHAQHQRQRVTPRCARGRGDDPRSRRCRASPTATST